MPGQATLLTNVEGLNRRTAGVLKNWMFLGILDRIRNHNLFVRLRLQIRILPSTSKKQEKQENLDFYCFVTFL
jgi:hypothetical protein